MSTQKYGNPGEVVWSTTFKTFLRDYETRHDVTGSPPQILRPLSTSNPSVSMEVTGEDPIPLSGFE